MKKFSEFLESWSSNPNDDVSKYITGLFNRLSLLRPEEIDAVRSDLEELRGLLNNVLKR